MSDRDHINPAHYGAGEGRDNPYETIVVMEAWFGAEAVIAFCQLNAVKYISRAGKKAGEPMSRDLAKARWYIDHAAMLAKKREDTGG